MLLLAAEAAAGGGWAHLVGLLAAVVIAVLGVGTHQWRLSLRAPSPTPPDDPEENVTPGETDDTDPDDTDLDTADDPSWWGRRIRMADGSVLVRPPSGTGGQTYEADEAQDEDEDDEENETREELADRLVQMRCRYSDAVHEIMNAFDVSESTAKRDLAKATDRARG